MAPLRSRAAVFFCCSERSMTANQGLHPIRLQFGLATI